MKSLSAQNLPPVGSSGTPFATTHWTVVREAGQNGVQALETLCRAYWYPLYAYLRRSGRLAHDAQELTQGFFVHLLSDGTLAKAQPERGRFRTFLLAGLNNYVRDQWDKARSVKRGGDRQILSLDERDAEDRYLHEPPDTMDPETLYEKKWVLAVIDQALENLKNEWKGQGRETIFETLGPLMQGERNSQTYAEAGRKLGISESAVKVTIHRMRSRYRELLRNELAQTVESAEDVEDEINHFFAVLNR